MNKGIILIAVLTLVLTGEIKDIKKKNGGPAFTPLIAGVGTGFFLFIINMISTDLAKLLSYLVILGALAVNGPDLFGSASKIIGGQQNG